MFIERRVVRLHLVEDFFRILDQLLMALHQEIVPIGFRLTRPGFIEDVVRDALNLIPDLEQICLQCIHLGEIFVLVSVVHALLYHESHA